MALLHIILDSGHRRLKELGYKQELKRDLSVLSNFAFSFSVIAILTGVTTLYNTGLSYGGPISMTYGWLIAGVFTMSVALSMAEICSAYPISGGLYFWSYKLAGKEWGPFASWITGWFNIVGQWAGTTSVEYSLAVLLQVIILLSTGGANGGGYMASKYTVLGFHGGFLSLHAAINCLPVAWLSYLATFASAWNVIEETRSSDKNGPYGIISSVALSIVVGWAYVLGITFAVTDLPHVLDPANDANGYAIAQVFYDAFKNRYGSGAGGIACLGIAAVATFFCGIGCITSTSRMTYAFSRDGAMPFSRVWHAVNKQHVPLNAVWLTAVIPFIMALTSLGSLVAFQAMVSVATIGVYITYALPSLFRITLARKTFIPGPFSLGRFSLFMGWVSVLWVATISILFSLPVQYPVTANNLNYAPIAIGGVFVLVMASWFVSARFWFKGPVPLIENLSQNVDPS